MGALIILTNSCKKDNSNDFSNNPTPTPTPVIAIGDSYQGGLVFYIFRTGDNGYIAGQTHGLIAAPTDQSIGAEWGCAGTAIGGTSTAINTGAANTNAIVAGCTTAGIAAKLCYDLVLNTYSDWYLPSRDELNLMYVNLKTQSLGSFASYAYWSSSESGAYGAWVQSFIDGNQYSGGGNQYTGYGKSYPYYVRAVRAF